MVAQREATKNTSLFSRTVPRHLVHKSAVAEVLITSWTRRGPDNFLVAAQWPREHGLYDSVESSWHDPMLVAETIRQTALLLSQAEYDLPPDHQFVLDELAFAAEPGGLVLDGGPAQVLLEVVSQDVRRRGGALSGMRIHAHIVRDTRYIGSAGVTFRCVSPEVYGRLRPLRSLGETPPAQPIRPELVGRDRARDVVLAPASRVNAWTLRVDRKHPQLFDHPVDHVPGMAVLEGLRQAVVCAVHPRRALPIGLDARFLRYVEHDAPCQITAHVGGRSRDGGVEIESVAEQAGERAAVARIAVLLPEPPACRAPFAAVERGRGGTEQVK